MRHVTMGVNMTNENQRLTINSRGEIGPKPYGPSRWASPRTYTCAHPGCRFPASVFKPANAHAATTDAVGDAAGAAGEHGAASVAVPAKAHNCCGTH